MNQTIPKYVLVENRIKESIRRREITAKLPGERVLSRNFGFSYMTIRKAIENLVAQGLLYKVPARGTYVVEQAARELASVGKANVSGERGRQGLSGSKRVSILAALEKRPEKMDAEKTDAVRTASPVSSAQIYLKDMRKVDLVQSLQLAEGSVSCFATAIDGVCDQVDCVWRKDCFSLARKRRTQRVSITVESALEFLQS